MLIMSDLQQLIVDWKEEHGEEIRGRNGKTYMGVPIDSDARIHMYKTLMKTLITLHEYSDEDLKVDSQVYRAVMKASVNPTSENKDKWHELATVDWRLAFRAFYKNETIEYTQEEITNEIKEEKPKKERIKYDKDLIPRPELDRSIFSKVPKPEIVVDVDFLKKLEEVGDE